MNTYRKIDHAFESVFQILIKLGGIMCFLMMVLSVLNVITRSFFNSPIFGTVELISYFGLTLGALALAMNELSDGNVSMTLVVDLLPAVPKKLLDAVMTLIATAFYAAITYRYAAEVIVTFASKTATSTLAIPHYLINAVMAIGYFFAALSLLLKVARDIAFVAANGKNKNGGETV